jgi:hypothetical protein
MTRLDEALAKVLNIPVKTPWSEFVLRNSHELSEEMLRL